MTAPRPICPQELIFPHVLPDYYPRFLESEGFLHRGRLLLSLEPEKELAPIAPQLRTHQGQLGMLEKKGRDPLPPTWPLPWLARLRLSLLSLILPEFLLATSLISRPLTPVKVVICRP